MKQELLTDALGTLDADIIGDYLATEKKLKKRRAKRFVSALAACLAFMIVAIPVVSMALKRQPLPPDTTSEGTESPNPPAVDDNHDRGPLWHGVMTRKSLYDILEKIDDNDTSVFTLTLTHTGKIPGEFVYNGRLLSDIRYEYENREKTLERLRFFKKHLEQNELPAYDGAPTASSPEYLAELQNKYADLIERYTKDGRIDTESLDADIDDMSYSFGFHEPREYSAAVRAFKLSFAEKYCAELKSAGINCSVEKETLYLFATKSELGRAFDALSDTSSCYLSIARKMQYESDAGLLDDIAPIEYTASELADADLKKLTVSNYYISVDEYYVGHSAFRDHNLYRDTDYLAKVLSLLVTEANRRNDNIVVRITIPGMRADPEYDWKTEDVLSRNSDMFKNFASWDRGVGFTLAPENLTPEFICALSNTRGFTSITISSTSEYYVPLTD